MKVAVVGAGWSGLAAAVELVAGGAELTLYEAGRHPGGRARGVEFDGRRLDNGQHLFLGAYRECLALLRQIGLDPTTRFRRFPLRIGDNAGFHLALPRLPAPLHLAWGLLTARGLPAREKLAAALWMQALRRREFRLAVDTSVAAWLDSAGQHGILRRHLWEPLCLAALNTPAERASARVFANVLRDSLGSPRREDTDLLLPRGDLGSLFPEPAAAWLEARGANLRFGHRVRMLTPGSSSVIVDGERYDVAVVAVAPQHLGRLLPELALDYDYEPIATVYLDDRGPPLAFPLLALHGGIGQWVVDRGDGHLAAVLSGHGEWESYSDDELARRLHAELGRSDKLVWRRVIRERRATFSCRPGLDRPPLPSPRRGIFLAGDFACAEYPGTLEAAVRSGRAAARAALGGKPGGEKFS